MAMTEAGKIGKQERVLADRACREGQRRDADREAARTAMYDQIARVYGAGDDGDHLRQKAAARRTLVEVQADPLGILRRPAATEGRKASGQALAKVRRERDGLLRSSGTVRRLLTQGAIGRREVQAADELLHLWELAAGGSLVRALDWTLERVDGGRRVLEPDLLIGAGDAERALWRVRCHVGARTWSVLVRVCCHGESVAAVAMDMEDDPAGKTNGACSRQTRDHVSRLLRSGLMDAAEVMGVRPEAMCRDARQA